MAEQDFWQSILEYCSDVKAAIPRLESMPRNTELIDISPFSEDLNMVDDIFETKDLLDPSDSIPGLCEASDITDPSSCSLSKAFSLQSNPPEWDISNWSSIPAASMVSQIMNPAANEFLLEDQKLAGDYMKQDSELSWNDKSQEIEISSPCRLMPESLINFNSLQIHADHFPGLLFQDNKQFGDSVGSFESGVETTAAAAAIRSDESIGTFNHNLCPPSNILQPDEAIDYIFPPCYNLPAMPETSNAAIYAASSAPSSLIHDDSNYFNSSWNEANNSTAISALCAQSRAGNHQRGSTDKITDITLNELSRYFNMPITQAAKELKVGLTVLKKRCREFGIPRWPHRKMKSLESLIHNIQELGKNNGGLSNARLKNAVQILEEQKRLMEEMPGIELAERTKRLRQACFKASYKKRRQMAIESANTGGSEGSTS